MSKSTQIIFWLVVAVLIAVAGFQFVAGGVTPMLGGDFAGGVTPTNLLTASVSNGGVTPVGNLAFGFGGTAPANQIVTLYTATEAYPATAFNLGAITNATSATSTSFGFTASGFSVGDPCEVGYNGATTTSAFGADAFVTAVSGNAVTTTVTFWNGSSAAITLTATSSATGVSSTLKTTCFHTGV